MTHGEEFTPTGPLWRWTTANSAGLVFLRRAAPIAEEISALALLRRLESGQARGWGPLRVTA